MLHDVIKKWGGCEVTAMDVYSDMFKLGQGYIQRENEPPGQFKANPIAYYRDDMDSKGHFRIMFEDTFEETLQELQQAQGFAIMNGITYFGRRNLQANASKMYAMIFDLDEVTDETLNNFFSAAVNDNLFYPAPNYVILSGHGVHLYYIFEEPIDLYPYTKIQLKELKYALTRKIWNRYTSEQPKPQYQGINQGFRVIGSKTKPDAPEPVARAFRVNKELFTLDKLNIYVPDDSKINQQQLWKESKCTLAEAKERYPEWYQTVVVEKKEWPRNYWQISKKVHGDNPYALYDWWLRQIASGAAYGHRYFDIMCMAIYAIKCQVPFDKLKQDALDLVPILNALKPECPFTEQDCLDALECYDLRYSTFPIKDISKLTEIVIPRNKRNGLTQEQHLYLARRRKDDMKNIGLKMKGPDGRPKGSGTAEKTVKQWRQEHPDGRKVDCQRDTGLSKPTVLKWWGD
nr:unnamed protein product [uncultured bacterium]